MHTLPTQLLCIGCAAPCSKSSSEAALGRAVLIASFAALSIVSHKTDQLRLLVHGCLQVSELEGTVSKLQMDLQSLTPQLAFMRHKQVGA